MWPQKGTSSRNARRLKKAAFEHVSFPLQVKLLWSSEKNRRLADWTDLTTYKLFKHEKTSQFNRVPAVGTTIRKSSISSNIFSMELLLLWVMPMIYTVYYFIFGLSEFLLQVYCCSAAQFWLLSLGLRACHSQIKDMKFHHSHPSFLLCFNVQQIIGINRELSVCFSFPWNRIHLSPTQVMVGEHPDITQNAG